MWQWVQAPKHVLTRSCHPGALASIAPVHSVTVWAAGSLALLVLPWLMVYTAAALAALMLVILARP
jgi:hypothetical protein